MSARGVWLKVRALLAPARAERELDDELRFHLEMETQANERRGMSPEDARRLAYTRFGGVERFKEQTREVRGTRWVEDVVRDSRQGLRALANQRVFAAAALVTIALGVGATTAVFSVVRGVLLRPLPFPEPDQLVTVWFQNLPQGIEEDVTSYPDFSAWRERGSTFQHMAVVRATRPTLTGHGDPEEVVGASVTRGFFDMLGVPLALGRGFRPEESEGDDPVGRVVLSHELWTGRFGGDSTLVGRTIQVNGLEHEVIGVTAPGRRHPADAQLWTPLTFAGNEDLRDARSVLWLPVLGRLADGVGLAEAQAQMSGVAAQLAAEYPSDNEGTGITLEPLHETLVGDVRTPLLVLLGAVALVLMIAAANVANLLLARGASRGREMAVRLAMGAGRGRLARQLLAESTALGVLGGLFGTALAVVGVHGLLAVAPPELPRLDGVRVDRSVLAFALLLSLATSLLFGVVPALQAGDRRLPRALRAGGRGASEGGLERLRAAFVAAQFALALVLLAGSGLLVKSFANLQAIDPGMNPHGVLSFRVTLPSSRYPDYERVSAFYDRLLPALETLPAARGAAAVYGVLRVQLSNSAQIALESRPDLDTRPHPVYYEGATPDFIDVLEMRLLTGRRFTAEDGRSSPRVAIVSESFARTFLPDVDPLGERFSFGGPDWITIVGVVADAQRWGVGAPVRPYVFQPMTQRMESRAEVVVRANGDPAGLVAGARRAVAEVDPLLAITQVRTLEQALSGSLAQHRFLMLMLVLFAASATVLAAVGIYGVMAYLVGRRTREIAVRIALGAPRSAVLGGVLRAAAAQVGAGVGAGLVGAFVLTRFLRAQLFGLGPTDPATFAAVSALLVAVALVASLVPARRAAGVEPSVALREE